eukprot:s104_g16.t1
MEIKLRHPGGTWLTSDVETTTTLPAGLSLWACDVRLADVLLARPKLAKGHVVLDLGCGCALPSIAAARVAKRVFAADAEDAVLRNAAVNLRRNGAGAVLLRKWQGGSLAEYSWRRKDVRELRRVALLLCSDPLRSEGSAECFMQTLVTVSRWFRTPARLLLHGHSAGRSSGAAPLHRALPTEGLLVQAPGCRFVAHASRGPAAPQCGDLLCSAGPPRSNRTEEAEDFAVGEGAGHRPDVECAAEMTARPGGEDAKAAKLELEPAPWDFLSKRLPRNPLTVASEYRDSDHNHYDVHDRHHDNLRSLAMTHDDQHDDSTR